MKTVRIQTHRLLFVLFSISILSMDCATQGNPNLTSFYQHYNKSNSSGVVIAIIKGDFEWIQGFGTSDPQTKRPLNGNTVFELASLSKAHTATAVLRLQEKGLLSVRHSIRAYLPELPKYMHPVQIHHLIHHTSGVAGYHKLCQGNDRVTPRRLISHLQSQPGLSFSPGTQFQYSNTGYVLLALAMERVSQKSYGEILNEEIFQPLGMRNSEVWQEKQPEGKAFAYFDGSQTKIELNPCNYLYGQGRVQSSAKDLVKWLRGLSSGMLANKKLFKETSLLSGKSVPYGFGWSLELDGERVYWHNGRWLGNSHFAGYLPEKDTWVLILSNRPTLDGIAEFRKIRSEL